LIDASVAHGCLLKRLPLEHTLSNRCAKRERKSARVILSKFKTTRSRQEITKEVGLKWGVRTDTHEYKKQHISGGRSSGEHFGIFGLARLDLASTDALSDGGMKNL
jgi:hypothetical protein